MQQDYLLTDWLHGVTKTAHAEPTLEEALAIALPHLSKAGTPLDTSRREHSATLDINVPGSNTTLDLNVEAASNYLPSTAMVTTQILLSETARSSQIQQPLFHRPTGRRSNHPRKGWTHSYCKLWPKRTQSNKGPT